MLHAVHLQEPPPAGVVAAGVVLLAGAIASTVLRRQEEAQQLAVQQRVVLKQRAEELKAQKAVSGSTSLHACLCYFRKVSLVLSLQIEAPCAPEVCTNTCR
jgi:hypothetical protein